MLICLSMIAPILTEPLTVYADYDGSQGSGSGQYGQGTIGASETHESYST